MSVPQYWKVEEEVIQGHLSLCDQSQPTPQDVLSAATLGLVFDFYLFPSDCVLQDLPPLAGIAWNLQGTPCLCLPPPGNSELCSQHWEIL